STGARVTAVEILPCDSEPCTLRRGVNYIARVTFTANVNVGVGGFTVQGVVGSRPMTVPLPPNGLCVYLFPGCPIEVGGSYVYHYTGAVPLEFPPTQASIWEVSFPKEQSAPSQCRYHCHKMVCVSTCLHVAPLKQAEATAIVTRARCLTTFH
ncbi:hypothetical protein X801_05199, partial [Opisthorchis viverrini]